MAPDRRAMAINWLAGLMVAAAASPFAIPSMLRLIFAAPFVFFLPGYAVLNAIIGQHLSGLTALTLSCGLSFAITILLGLVLNVTTGLTPLAWAVALAGTTLLAFRIKPEFELRILPDAEWHSMAPPRTQLALLSSGALIFILSISIARDGVFAYQPFRVTEFWMLPARNGAQNTFTVGITNKEGAPTVYNLRLALDGVPAGALDGVMVGDGATWTADMPIALRPGDQRRLEAWLVRADRPGTVYRRVWLGATPTFKVARDRQDGSSRGAPFGMGTGEERAGDGYPDESEGRAP